MTLYRSRSVGLDVGGLICVLLKGSRNLNVKAISGAGTARVPNFKNKIMKKNLEKVLYGMLFLSYGLTCSLLLCIPIGMLFNTGCFGAKHSLFEWVAGVFFMLLAAASQNVCFKFFIKKLGL